MRRTIIKGKTTIFYWLVFSILAFRLLFFVYEFSVDLFFNDQWNYLTTLLFPNDLVDGFFTRLGPHRIGLGYPFFKSALALSDYNNKTIAFMVAGFAILNGLLFTHLKIKRVGQLKVTDIYIPLVWFTLNQYAIFLNNPNISIHQLVFTLLLAVVILLSGKMKSWKFIVILLLTPLMTFTGNGFFLSAALLGFGVLMRIKSKDHQLWWLGVIVVSALSLGAYLYTANYKAMDCAGIPSESSLYYLKFLKGLLLNGLVVSYQEGFASWLLFIILTGLGGFIAIRYLLKYSSCDQLAPLLILGYVILFFAATTIGRWCFGLLITESSRYVPHAALGLMAFSLFSCNRKVWRNLSFGAFLTVSFIYAEYKFYRWRLPIVETYTENMRSWKKCYQEHGNASECNKKEGFQPYPGNIKEIKLQEKLKRLEKLNPSYRN